MPAEKQEGSPAPATQLGWNKAGPTETRDIRHKTKISPLLPGYTMKLLWLHCMISDGTRLIPRQLLNPRSHPSINVDKHPIRVQNNKKTLASLSPKLFVELLLCSHTDAVSVS